MQLREEKKKKDGVDASMRHEMHLSCSTIIVKFFLYLLLLLS